MASSSQQSPAAQVVENPSWIRVCSLFVVNDSSTIDLSAFRFTFKSTQADQETPNNCVIRVYNLSDTTVARIKGEYKRVIVQAGYKNGPAGVVFSGEIRQFGAGREDAKDTYFDLLAADGDTAYSYGYMSQTFDKSSTHLEKTAAAISAMSPYGVKQGYVAYEGTGGVLPRGAVKFGLARAQLRGLVKNVGATWNINGGKVNIVPLDGYLPGEAVILNSATGLIGRVEQTVDGMRCRCLINPKLGPGTLLKIDNKSINTTQSANPLGGNVNAPQIPFDSYKGLQRYASIAADGLYRVYVAEHEGDSRGQEWYTNIIGLAVNPSTLKVISHA